ncbi:MAG: hypothetical protein SOT14_11185 [Succinivibrio sp.]|nr:hypothetical protein [Succinivibrio sp.]
MGRLDDGTHEVALSEAYLADHPQYTGCHVFYEDKALVVRSDKEAEEIRKKAAAAAAAPRKRRLRACEGPAFALWEMAQDSELLGSLHKVFGESAGDGLLRLAIFKFCQDQAPLQGYGDWLCWNFLPEAEPLDRLGISSLLSAIGQDQIAAFIRLRRESTLKRLCKAGPSSGTPPLLAFDACAASTCVDPAGVAERVFPETALPMMQQSLALCVDYATGDPCFARIAKGEIGDTSLFLEQAELMKRSGLDLSEVLLVSNSSLMQMSEAQEKADSAIKFLIRLPLTERHARLVLGQHRRSLEDMQRLDTGAELYAASAHLDEWTLPGSGAMVDKDAIVHLYRNSRLEADETVSFKRDLDLLLEALNSGRIQDVDPAFLKSSKPYLKAPEGSGKWTFNFDALNEAVRYSGCFVLVTNAVSDPLEALAIYGQKYVAETAFRQFVAIDDGRHLMGRGAPRTGRILLHLLSQALALTAIARLRAGCEGLRRMAPADTLAKAMGILRKASCRSLSSVEAMDEAQEIMRALGA